MPITKIIDNFSGILSRDSIGDMNSGLVKYATSFGYDPFANVGNLTWLEAPVQIDPNASVITDLIMAGKERLESGISYVYAIGHTGRLYKIQVNQPSGFNPNLDNPVLITTLTINSPTFTRGGSIDFFGSTEKIYIGHDMGVTSINFDGSGEAFVGVLGSWTQTIPRPLKQFVGNLYVGNGKNIAEIGVGAIVNTYAKLSPAFPDNTQIRDMDLSPDGIYLEIVVTRLALPDLTSTVQDTTIQSNAESYIFKWNGTDIGYTSFTTFPSFSLNSNVMFGNYQYTFGYDISGAVVFNPIHKILTTILAQAPLPNAAGSNGNIIGWMVPEFYNGFLAATQFLYGPLDSDFPSNSWYRVFRMAASQTETDVVRIPFSLIVSNFVLGSVTNGYTGGVVGVGKQYFSTLESSPAPTKKYKLYKITTVGTGFGVAIGGVYETQNETSVKLFRSVLKQKLKVYEVRVFGEGWITSNSFLVDIIGFDGNPIANASYTFTAGTNMTIGSDLAKYNPSMAPAHSIGLRITNLGPTNFAVDKIEIDIDEVEA